MGIYDRDYYRGEQRGFTLRWPQSVVVTLIVINVALYLVDALFFPRDHELTTLLSASDETLRHPWLWWQLLSSGFAHDPGNWMHVGMNMLGLWFLGPPVERRYGSMEFLRVYLVMIVVGSLSWAIPTALGGPYSYVNAMGQQVVYHPSLLGASGAVTGIVFLFILNYPHQTLILFPIPIPVKAWVVGIMLIVANVYGAKNQIGNIAYGVHLAGVGFAYLYFQFGWNLKWMAPSRWNFERFKPKPRLRVHHPEHDDAAESDLRAEVDRILAKIHSQGEASLTRKERRTLESASRKFQKNRQDPDE